MGNRHYLINLPRTDGIMKVLLRICSTHKTVVNFIASQVQQRA